MKRKSNRYEAVWWAVDLPARWSVKVDPECTTFTSAKLRGALQLSAYRKNSGINEREIIDFADKQPKPKRVKVGTFAGLCNSYDVEGTRWMKWWLVRDRTLIVATYNGPIPSAKVEIRAAEEVLKTLRLR